MTQVICPDCAFKANKSLAERKKIGAARVSYTHSVCNDCGSFMYVSHSGLKWSRNMEFIMYHVERDQERHEHEAAAYASALSKKHSLVYAPAF